LEMKFELPLILIPILAASLALPQSTITPAAKKTGAAKAGGVKSSKKGKSARKGAASNSAGRQVVPAADRYREIQQALVEKGYLKSEPDGVWDGQSSDALRQFQTDRNLSPTGKLSSASLIALGLGPKPAASSPPRSSPPTGVSPPSN
jgi:hypothetical protein